MATKAEMLNLLNTVVDKVEDVQAAISKASDNVDEALRAAAEAFGTGMEAGSDADVANTLMALRQLLDEAIQGAAACLSAAQESASRHA